MNSSVREHAQSTKATYMFLVALVVLCATALRIHRLEYQSLWLDEILTVVTSSLDESTGNIWEIFIALTSLSLEKLNVMPLFNIIIYPIVKSTNDEFWLRLPSVVFGVSSVLLLFLIIREWFGYDLAIRGAILMSVSPFHVWFSQDFRPYSLLLFLSLLSLWFLQLFIRSPTNGWLRSGFVVSTSTLLYSHTVGIAFIGFTLASVLLLVPRQDWKRWIPVFAAVAVLTVPGFFLIAAQMIGGGSPGPAKNISYLPLVVAPYTMWVHGAGYSMGPTVSELHSANRLSIVMEYLPIILPTMLIFSAIFALGMVSLFKKNRKLFYLILMWLMFPFLFAVAGALATGHSFNVRYTIIAVAPFMLTLAAGLRSLPKWLRAGGFGLLILIFLYSLSNYYYNPRYQRENYRGAGEFLAKHAASGDLVIACVDYSKLGIEYYYGRYSLEGRNPEFVACPISDAGATITGANAADSRLDPQGANGSSAANDRPLRELVAGRERIWLFFNRTYDTDLEERYRNILAGTLDRGREYFSNGVALHLYQKSQ